MGVTRETRRKERNKATGREKERKGKEGKENVGVRSCVGWLPNLVS